MPRTAQSPVAADTPAGHDFYAAASGLRSAGDSAKVGDFVVTRQTDYIEPPKQEIVVTTHQPGSVYFEECDHVVEPKDVFSFEGTAFQDDVGDAWGEWVKTKNWSESIQRAIEYSEVFPFEFWEHAVKERVGVETVYVCSGCISEEALYPTIAQGNEVVKFDTVQYRCSECLSFYNEFSEAKACCS